MSVNHSTQSRTRSKPSKPYPDFPLTANGNGQWSKKIRGKVYYFGVWEDPDAALENYLKQKDALHAGRKPRPDTDNLTIKEVVNDFLNTKLVLVDTNELTPRMWTDYKEACDLIIEQFGKSRLVDDVGPDDFAELRNKMAERWGLVRLGNVIQRIRSVFNYALDNGLVEKTIRFGQGFKRPSKKRSGWNERKRAFVCLRRQNFERSFLPEGCHCKP